jgi:hypothetical protein
MIYEYAIDPALVKDWVLNRTVGLAGKFGMDQRRIVSDIADNWRGEVWALVLNHFDLDCTNPEYIDAEQHMTMLLQYLEQDTNRGIKRSEPWIKQVLQIHQMESFHAILAHEKIQGCEAVITPDIESDLRNPRWYLPTIEVTSKTAEALTKQLTPFLRLANKIILVDPYFDASEDKYCEVLASLLTKAVSTRAIGRAFPEVDVISGVDHRQKGKESSAISAESQHLKESNNRCAKAKQRLGSFIPSGMSITFKCVSAFKNGDEVHNRYLLTDLGGVTIPYGTDSLGEHIFDDVTPLYKGQYRTRWKQYGKSEGLNVIGKPVVIQGQLSVTG